MDSEDSMETSQGSGRMREKRENNFEGIRAKKTRRCRSFERRVEERFEI